MEDTETYKWEECEEKEESEENEENEEEEEAWKTTKYAEIMKWFKQRGVHKGWPE